MNLPTLDGSNRERLLEEIYGACERWREQIARVPWGQIHALAKAAEMGQLLRDIEDIARHLLALERPSPEEIADEEDRLGRKATRFMEER